MDVLYERCAGLDVSKRDAKACVRVTGAGGKATQTVTTWTSMTNQVRELAQYLLTERVRLVVIEATSDYWDSQKLHQMGEPNASLRQLGG